MTENKRFINHDDTIMDNQGEQLISTDEIVDKLNELAEENKKLKQVNEMLQMDFAMTERNLLEENDQLKQEYQKLKHRIAELELLNDGLNYALKNIRKIDVEVDIG